MFDVSTTGPKMSDMKRPRLLINCSNLHVGGSVAVASSFISSLAERRIDAEDVDLLLSSAVAANLRALGADLSRFGRHEVVDFHGISSLWRGLGRRFAGYDVVFTVFGPAYAMHLGRWHIFGFAQALIAYPGNAVEQSLPTGRRLLHRLRYKLQELFFARASELVVELEHVQVALRRLRRFSSTPIHVVRNTVDSVFGEPARWSPVSMPDRVTRVT